MPSVRVGQTEIAYELRRTATASERRITVTPGCVEVLALTTDDDTAIESFLDRKRQWLFDTVRELEEVTADRTVVPRFMTGSKIPFRGRLSSLTVRRHDGTHIEIAHKTGFIVDLPSRIAEEATDAVVATEIKLWLKRRVRRDVHEIAAAYEEAVRSQASIHSCRGVRYWLGIMRPEWHNSYRLATGVCAKARPRIRRRPRIGALEAPVAWRGVLGVPWLHPSRPRAAEGLARFASGIIGCWLLVSVN